MEPPRSPAGDRTRVPQAGSHPPQPPDYQRQVKSWVRQVPLAVQLITYISDSCSREPFATEVAEKLCFEHVTRGHNPESKPNTSGDGQLWGSPRGKNNTCRSNPWPNECLPRMKCTPQQCRETCLGKCPVPRAKRQLFQRACVHLPL